LALFSKKNNNVGEKAVHVGRASQVNASQTEYSPFRTKSTKLLQRLRQEYNVYDAIDLLIEEHPDTSMGYSVLQALVNQGGKIEFSGCSERTSRKLFEEWEAFAERVNAVNSSGLDGLLVQLHGFDFRYGGMGCEVVVNGDCTDIEDIYPIAAKYIKWKLEDRNGEKKWIPYQCVNGKEIDLSQANFLWIPFNPLDTPKGTLLFETAIPAADMQLEFLNSSQAVLYRVGCPRYDIKLNREAIVASMPPDVKSNAKKQQEFITNVYEMTKASFANLSAENDIIHTDDVIVDTIGGDSSAYFQGISAYADVIDVQMMNAVKTLKTLMNRSSSGSYALSTVEFKVIVDMIEPRQRAEKRLVESIARLWLRVHGYNAKVKYTPNPIEWQTMLDKIDYQLKNQQFYRRSDEYGYISPDEAAHKINGSEKAFAERKGLFEYIKKLFNAESTNSSNDDTENNNDGG
jgi:hypothetical protein